MHFVDLKNEKPDKDAAKLMSDLCQYKIPKRLDKGNRRAYEVDWVGMTGQRYSYRKYSA